MDERMAKWFEVKQGSVTGDIEIEFQKLARNLIDVIPSGPERTVALRKLLESRDAAIRSALVPGA